MSAQLLKKTAVLSSLGLGLALAVSAASLAQTSAPPAGARAKAKAKAQAAAKAATPLDLNTASPESMVETLPGVGEATARKIVAGRPYKSVDDLARAGVPKRTIDQIRPMVTVAATPAMKPKQQTFKNVRGTVERRTPAAGTATATPAPAGKVDLNHATAEELQALPGIGPAHAQAIIAARPFRSPEDLFRVRGLGRRAEALLGRVTATPVTPPAAPETTAAAKPAAAKPAMKRPAAGTRPAPLRVAPGALVDLNTASKAQLDALPGIGPVKAQAIIDARPFKSKEDVMRVKGIKQGEFAKIRDLIEVE